MNQDARILVVDDDAVIIKIITNILHKNDYQTAFCHSGEAALELVQAEVFDLVLLDVQMGKGLDGYETCKMMQKIKPDLPVILVTANQDDESVNKGFESHSSDYIKKPVSKLELLARVNKTITLKRTEKKNLQLLEDFRKDLRTAATIQEAMLPKWIYIDSNILFSSNYQASELVGGDLFDRIKLEEKKYVVYIGDISGHGVQAALLMTAVKAIIKLLVEAADRETDTLAQLFTKLNERIYHELFTHGNYMTMLMGVIDLEMNEFRFLNAGHPPLIIVDTNTGEARVRDEKGSVPLGWMPQTKYIDDEIDRIPLREDQIYLLYTDGIYECNNPQDEQFGLDGLIDVLNHHIPIEGCISLAYKIKHHLIENQYEIADDDFTLFSFQIQNQTIQERYEPGKIMTEVKRDMFILRSALRDVGKKALQCEELIQNWTLNKSLAAKVELIVDEFLNNIISYGYNYAEDAIIVIEFKIIDSKLKIIFWDKGIHWVPEETECNDEKPYNFDLDLMNVRGKGIKIIKSLTHKFLRKRYEHLNETTIEIKL